MSAAIDTGTEREERQRELAAMLRRHRELDTLARAAAAEAQRLSDALRREQEAGENDGSD